MFLEIKNTTFGYQSPLIHQVEAALALGEIGLLIGNNGVGKTTLVKSILNQIPVRKGEILLNQKNSAKLTAQEIAEQVAVVFSKAEIPANFTVYHLIALGKYIHYPYYFKLKTEDIAEIEAIIDQLQLAPFRNLSLDKLSDGNLQKAFIGRALAQNSPMIILDEPTTHLDEDNKIMVLQILRNLAEKHNKLILFSSHDWRLAKEFADKIWYIKDQRLQAGIAEDIILGNEELASPQLFNIHSAFIAPNIIAPELRKELLFSFLQKNYKRDLSGIKIEWEDTHWEVSKHNYQKTANKFEDISAILAELE